MSRVLAFQKLHEIGIERLGISLEDLLVPNSTCSYEGCSGPSTNSCEAGCQATQLFIAI
jgi:hypothetical protein